MTASRYGNIALAGTQIALWIFAIMRNGIPSLRHDWIWPVTADQARWSFIYSTSAWSPAGLGQPNAYIGGYLYGALVGIINVLVSPNAGLACFLLFCAGMLYLAIRALARSAGAHEIVATAATAIVLFNPWTYNETVAGHTYLVLALAGTLWFIGGLLEPDTFERRSAIALILSVPQTQIFIVLFTACAIVALRRHQMRGLLCGAILALPQAVSIGFALSSISQTPLTLAWQIVQSADLKDAALLGGYAAAYSDRLGLLASISMMIVCAVSFASPLMTTSGMRRKAGYALAIAVTATIVSTGTKGIIAYPYHFLVAHVHVIGLFRELYDLLLFAVAAYALVILIARWGRFEWLRVTLISIAALGGIASWVVHPPSDFFVDRARLPVLEVHGAQNSRFALYPALQPFSFGGKGSGADPDAYGRTGDISPLNDYVNSYPELPALCGSASDLAALGVSDVEVRPWLRSVENACVAPRFPQRSFHATPLVSVTEKSIVSLGRETLRPSILWSDDDTPGASSSLAPIPGASIEVDPVRGWVDARLAFGKFPATAQAYGGWTTTNERAKLLVPADVHYILVWASNALYDRKQRLTIPQHAFSWVRLSSGLHSITCRGLCTVAVSAKRKPVLPLEAPIFARRAVDFRQQAPWLLNGICTCDGTLLVYNERFAGGWLAVMDSVLLEHIRVSGYANGWLITHSKGTHRFTILYWPGALATILEPLCALVCALLLVRLGKDSVGS